LPYRPTPTHGLSAPATEELTALKQDLQEFPSSVTRLKTLMNTIPGSE